MVIDTSVLIAIAFGEPEALRFSQAIFADQKPLISAASVLETSIVLLRQGPDGLEAMLDTLLDDLGLTVISVDEDQSHLARQAYRWFGRTRHRAQLNFGDCFSYALAKQLNEPLLFKGDDFIHTDVQIAQY